MRVFDPRGKHEPGNANAPVTAASRAAAAGLRKVDQAAAIAEYEQEQKSMLGKIARLRALRHAKEANDRLEAAQAAAALAAANKKQVAKKKLVARKTPKLAVATEDAGK